VIGLILSALAGAVNGALLMTTGMSLALGGRSRWAVLSIVCILIGSLLLEAGLHNIEIGRLRR